MRKVRIISDGRSYRAFFIDDENKRGIGGSQLEALGALIYQYFLELTNIKKIVCNGDTEKIIPGETVIVIAEEKECRALYRKRNDEKMEEGSGEGSMIAIGQLANRLAGHFGFEVLK